MKYLKVFTDFEEAICCLTDEEAGRLFRAMLRYAADGTVPELPGTERVLWVTARQNIDREAAFCGKQAENGRKGGRPPKAKRTAAEPGKKEAAGYDAHESAAPAAACGACPAEADAKTQTTQKDNDKEKDKDSKEALSYESGKKRGFLPPAREEIEAYCKKNGLNVDAAYFHTYYEQSGWRDGNGKRLRSWQQKLTAWDKREREANRQQRVLNGLKKGMGFDAPYKQTKLSEEEFEALFDDLG